MPMLVAEKLNMKDWIGKRKYFEQMSDEEVKGLFLRLKSVEESGQRWRMAGHTLDRIHQKGINADYWDIVSSVWNAEMVEYKIDENRFTGAPEERVVIVSNALINGSYRMKAVFSLTEKRIVTVWLNHVKDNHATLDYTLYDENMPVFGI
jgi:hypothetical protein